MISFNELLKFFRSKRGDIGYSYIIMIIIGIIGLILILYIWKGGFGTAGGKLLGLLNQTQP